MTSLCDLQCVTQEKTALQVRIRKSFDIYTIFNTRVLSTWDRAIADLFSQWDKDRNFYSYRKGKMVKINKHTKEDLDEVHREKTKTSLHEENEIEQREMETTR